jgi:hypothetical protein
MKTLKMFMAALMLLAAPFISKAQSGGAGFAATYGANTSGNTAGTLRVSTNTGTSFDYSLGQTNQYYPGARGGAYSSITVDFNYPFYPGWGVNSATISIATLDALTLGSTSLFYGGGGYQYRITKGPGYSIVGATFNYSLSISVYHAGL